MKVIESLAYENPSTVAITKSVLAIQIPSKSKNSGNGKTQSTDPNLFVQRALAKIVPEKSLPLKNLLRYELTVCSSSIKFEYSLLD